MREGGQTEPMQQRTPHLHIVQASSIFERNANQATEKLWWAFHSPLGQQYSTDLPCTCCRVAKVASRGVAYNYASNPVTVPVTAGTNVANPTGSIDGLYPASGAGAAQYGGNPTGGPITISALLLARRRRQPGAVLPPWRRRRAGRARCICEALGGFSGHPGVP